MRVDVGRPARRARRDVAVDRRVDDRMVDIGHPLLAVAVPAPRVLLVGGVEIGIGPERGEKGRLVVGRAAEPAPGQPRPGGDRVAPGDQLLGGARRDEIAMGEAAPFGRAGQHPLPFPVVFVQRVIEAGDHPRGVAEGRVLGDVLDALAVDPDLPAVVEAVEKFLAGVRQHRRAIGSRTSSSLVLPSDAGGLLRPAAGAIVSPHGFIVMPGRKNRQRARIRGARSGAACRSCVLRDAPCGRSSG